jgi:hypothetical protein
MGFVAVLPIFGTSIYQSCVSGQFFSKSPKKDAQKLICALFCIHSCAASVYAIGIG